jgi:16S rRNA (uracil1498-N3)-methyltransferase
MEYYYTEPENVDEVENSLALGGFEYKHLIKVLRKKPGDIINVTDGKKNIFVCKIINTDNNEIRCDIIQKKFDLYEPDIDLTLYISPLKNLSRFELAIEKAVELGVKTIYPVITEYTVNKNPFSKSRMERFHKVIISALGQSQRCYLPEFFNIISFQKILTSTSNSTEKIVMYESEKSDSKLKKILNKNVSLLIGPEGGFTKDEIQKLVEFNWQCKSLGLRKLRAETAAIVSIYDILK